MQISQEDLLLFENLKGLLLRGKWELTGQQAALVAQTLNKLEEFQQKLNDEVKKKVDGNKSK